MKTLAQRNAERGRVAEPGTKNAKTSTTTAAHAPGPALMSEEVKQLSAENQRLVTENRRLTSELDAARSEVHATRTYQLRALFAARGEVFTGEKAKGFYAMTSDQFAAALNCSLPRGVDADQVRFSALVVAARQVRP